MRSLVSIHGSRALFGAMVTCAAAVLVSTLPGMANPTTSSPSESPDVSGNLSDRQAVVRDRVARLEDRMFQISQALKKAEPEKAAQLIQAIGTSRSLLVRQKMDEIAKKLQANQYSEAIEDQKEIAADLQVLLKMLLEDPSKLEDRKEEINRLEALKKGLDDVIKEQSKEKRDAEAVARERGQMAPATQPESQPSDPKNAEAAPDLGKQSQCQRATAEKTKGLLEKMKDTPKGDEQKGKKDQEGKGDKQGGDQQGDKQQDPSPGAQDLQEAVPQQEQAAEKLDAQNPKGAAEKQAKALEKLEQARKSLEEKLQQLRKEQQEQLLAALESRFRAMLSRQLECNKATVRLADVGKDNWTRSDQLELVDLSQKEKWVSSEADKALYILKEEGTTVVFPQIVEQVRDDARDVGDRLAAADASESVRATQEAIAQALKELLEAVEKKQAENDPANSESENAEEGPQPLLPGSAELKLLRSCQLRVNQATLQAEKDRAKEGADLRAWEVRVGKLAQRQQQVHDMAKAMHESLTKPQ
jgi:hypothetical protein